MFGESWAFIISRAWKKVFRNRAWFMVVIVPRIQRTKNETRQRFRDLRRYTGWFKKISYALFIFIPYTLTIRIGTLFFRIREEAVLFAFRGYRSSATSHRYTATNFRLAKTSPIQLARCSITTSINQAANVSVCSSWHVAPPRVMYASHCGRSQSIINSFRLSIRSPLRCCVSRNYSVIKATVPSFPRVVSRTSRFSNLLSSYIQC